jgi:hypothetical protein
MELHRLVVPSHGEWRYWLAERLGSGDGEEWTLNTRQKAFEPFEPASVLFAPVGSCASLTIMVM